MMGVDSFGPEATREAPPLCTLRGMAYTPGLRTFLPDPSHPLRKPNAAS